MAEVRGGWRRRGGGLAGVVALAAALLAAVVPAGAQRGPVDLPDPRIAGDDRVATAEAVARRWVGAGGTSDAVVVVPRDRTAVALATAGLAGRLGTTTLLSDAPPRPSTVEVARAVGATRAVVVGGDDALAAGWTAAGFQVDRVRGADDGDPALAAAAARAVGTAATRAYLAGTAALPDALAAGPPAHREGAPLLLTAAAALDPHAAAAIEDLGVEQVVVLGGEVAVGAAVVADLGRAAWPSPASPGPTARARRWPSPPQGPSPGGCCWPPATTRPTRRAPRRWPPAPARRSCRPGRRRRRTSPPAAATPRP
jgi:hypothetical protein